MKALTPKRIVLSLPTLCLLLAISAVVATPTPPLLQEPVTVDPTRPIGYGVDGCTPHGLSLPCVRLRADKLYLVHEWSPLREYPLDACEDQWGGKRHPCIWDHMRTLPNRSRFVVYP